MYFSDEIDSFQSEQINDDIYEQESSPVEQDFNDSMSEAERRIKMANYYTLIIQTKLFQDDSPIAKAVELEMRNFAKDRLETLLGIKKPEINVTQNSSIFSEDEIRVLKALVSTAARRKSEVPQLNTIANLETPSVNQIKSQTTPKINIIKTNNEQNQQVMKELAKNIPESKKTVAKKIKTGRIRQMVPPDAIPMPKGEHFTAVSAMKAQEQTSKFDASLVQSALVVTSNDK